MSELDFKIKSLSPEDKKQLQKDYGHEQTANFIRALFTISRNDLAWLNEAAKEINKRSAFHKTSKSELLRLLIHGAKKKGVEKLFKSYTLNA